MSRRIATVEPLRNDQGPTVTVAQHLYVHSERQPTPLLRGKVKANFAMNALVAVGLGAGEREQREEEDHLSGSYGAGFASVIRAATAPFTPPPPARR